MRILVTGAAGFLGSALLRALASRAPDDEIVALDLAPSPDARVAARVTWLSGALDDRDTIERARLQDVDVVYHLASLPGALAERQPALGRRVNLDATLDLFDRLAGSGRRPRVVYASSVAVYGEMDGQPIWANSPQRGRQALTGRISGWPRSRCRIIPGVAGFPELRCGFQVSSRARERRWASARLS